MSGVELKLLTVKIHLALMLSQALLVEFAWAQQSCLPCEEAAT